MWKKRADTDKEETFYVNVCGGKKVEELILM